MRTRILLSITVSLLIAAEEAKDKAIKNERAKLQGTWELVFLEIDGKKPIADGQLQIVQAVFNADGTFTVKANEDIVTEAKTQIDPTKEPRTIDLAFTEGEMRGQKSLGIYELKADSFRYCRAAPGKDRPKEFSSKEGSDNTMAAYKRTKK